MPEDKLPQQLNRIGKAAFVEYFELFKAYADGKLCKADCIERLVETGQMNEAGAGIRTSYARGVFEAKRELDALLACSEARVSAEIVCKAKQLLDKYRR